MEEKEEKNSVPLSIEEQKISFFREHFLSLFEMLGVTYEKDAKTDMPTISDIELVWEKITGKYKKLSEDFRISTFYSQYPKIKKQFEKNVRPPSGKRVYDFLKGKEKNLSTIAKSDILEKTAIAYCHLSDPVNYPSDWVLEHLQKELGNQAAFLDLMKSSNKTYYLLYYFNEKLLIEYAIIEIDYSTTNDRNETAISGTIYDSNLAAKGLEGMGKLTDTDLNLFLEFEISLSGKSIKSLITLYKGYTGIKKIKFLQGTYSTIKRDCAPVCGACIVEKYINRENAETAMTNRRSPAYEAIKNLLYYKRIIVSPKAVNKITDVKEFAGIDFVAKNYAGLYKVSWVSRAQKSLFRIYGIIKKSGEILLKLPDGTDIKGVFKSLKDNAILHAALEYDFDGGYFQFQAVLKGGKMPKKGDFIEGVYAGIGFFSNEPGAGRVLLEFLEPYIYDKTKGKFNELKSEAIPLESIRQHTDGMKPEEIDFFWGEKNSFIESQSFLQGFGIEPGNESRLDRIERELNELRKNNK